MCQAYTSAMRYILLLLLIAWPASAGAFFYMILGQPSAHPDPAARAAAFTVGISGCSTNSVTVKAVAEGLVNGKRRTIPLAVVPLSGGYAGGLRQNAEGLMDLFPSSAVAVQSALPAEGVWVIHVVGSALFIGEKSALVILGGEGIDRGKTRLRSEPFTPGEVNTLLQSLAASQQSSLTL
jgi:hypothetical protein